MVRWLWSGDGAVGVVGGVGGSKEASRRGSRCMVD